MDVASKKGGTGVEREVAALREQQKAISGVLRALARSTDLQPVLDEVVEACRRLCAADHGALWLLEGESPRRPCAPERGRCGRLRP